MKKKFILSLLPIALVLGGLGVAKYNAKENAAYDEIEEDTLEHAEVFGGTNFLEPKVRKAYVDPIAANYTTIGVQTQEETGNKMSIRFVGLVKIVDKNGNGRISDELDNTRIVWKRGIWDAEGHIIKDYSNFESQKVYKSLANGGGSFTVDAYNAENGTTYTHFVTYALRNAPKNFSRVSASFSIETKDSSVAPVVSKTAVSSLNGMIKWSIDTSAIENGQTVMVKKTSQGFETILPTYEGRMGADETADFYARFESDFKNGESFIIVRTRWTDINRLEPFDSNWFKSNNYNVNTSVDGVFTEITEDKPCVILWTASNEGYVYGGSLKTVDFKANDDFKTAVANGTIDNFKLKVSYQTKVDPDDAQTLNYDTYYKLNTLSSSGYTDVLTYRAELITASCDQGQTNADIIPYNASEQPVTDPHTEGSLTIDAESNLRGYIYDSDGAWKNLSKINIRVQPEGFGKAYIASGSGEPGSTIGLVAEPLNGNKFVDWRDNNNSSVGKGETLRFQVPSNATDSYTITANFEYSYAGSVSQKDENGYFTFGLYPQTVVTNQTLINALDGGAGTDAAQGYKLYNGVFYVKQEVLNPGRLENDSMKFNNGNSFNVGEEYWFVVEPIVWDELYTLNAGDYDHRPVVVSRLCLDQTPYDSKAFTDNDYLYGTVLHNFINNTFYPKISSFSNVYELEFNYVYPFDVGNYVTFEPYAKRPFKITDYARAKGVSVDSNGLAYAWLRNSDNKAVLSDQLGNIIKEYQHTDLNTSPMAQYIGYRPISIFQGTWDETGFVKDYCKQSQNPYTC